MQINKISTSQNFGATIKDTPALRTLIGHLSTNRDKCACFNEEDLKKFFSTVHHEFPNDSDEFVLTKFSSNAYGDWTDNSSNWIAQGYVKSKGKRRDIRFEIDDKYLYNHYTREKETFNRQLHNALFWAKIDMERVDDKKVAEYTKAVISHKH